MRVAPHEQANLGQHSLQHGAADGSSVLVDATGALVDPDSPAGVFLSVAPMVTCMGCFLMPGLTAWQIYKLKETRDTPILPFLSMATQCMIWLCYGIMVQNATIYIPNSAGMVLGSIYTVVFHTYAAATQRRGLWLQYLFCAGLLFLMGSVLFFAEPSAARTIFGIVAAGGSVLFAFSPLAALITVIKTRSTESMPIKTSIILFLNGGLWFAFGTLVKPDPAVWVPNFLGTIGGTLQLLLHVYFAGSSLKLKYSPIPRTEHEK